MTEREVYEIKVDGDNPCVPKPVLTHLEIGGLPGSETMAASLCQQLEVRLNRSLPKELTPDRVAAALVGIAELRVHQVRGLRPKTEVSWADLKYPAFLWPFLRALGDVSSIEDAIEIKIIWPGSVEKKGSGYVTLRKADYWEPIVETLQSLVTFGSASGLEIAFALPKSKDGDVSVLAFVEADGRLASHVSGRALHESLIRSAFSLRFVEYVWGSVRWEYQRLSWYNARLGSVVQDAFR